MGNITEYISSLNLFGPSGIILLTSIILMVLYLRELKNTKLDLRRMMVTAVFVAISFVLYNIQFVKYPQGGGVSLLSMVPIMVLSLLYGKGLGLTAGMLLGLLKILNGFFVVHPAQFMLDYVLSTMALGLACVFGSKNKVNIFLGCLLAVALSVGTNIVSGVVYFGQYAPEGMNVIVYSSIYNLSSAGVEGLLSCILMVFLPIDTLKKALKNIMGSM